MFGLLNQLRAFWLRILISLIVVGLSQLKLFSVAMEAAEFFFVRLWILVVANTQLVDVSCHE